MRGRKTIINTVFSLVEEVVAIVCGFILPRIILSAFGSKYNGLITSITQFLSCSVLLRSGIGGATRAALYKPLVQKDKDEINSIIKATDIFMKKIGTIIAVAIVVFSVVYPFFVLKEFEYIFTLSLFLIIGLSTFAESFFGITYLILLQADQKLWVSSVLKSISYILNLIIAIILIKLNCGIHLVKLGSTLIYIAYPIALQVYVKRKYNLDSKVKPNNKAIAQRWDAFWHQVATFVMTNTDVIILTVFTNMISVSIYSVYNLVINGLKRTVQSFSNGLEAFFGDIIAREEEDSLRKNLSVIELTLYSISTILYSVAIVVILPFVAIYTRGIGDADYLNPGFAYILLLAQFFNSIRIPYQLVVQAAGHYKQTKRGAMIEPIINIVISVVFVIRFGLIGVAVGTLVSTIYRTIQFSNYMSKNIVKRNMFYTFSRIIIHLAECAIIIFIANNINIQFENNYANWLLNSVIVGIIAVCIVCISNIIFYRKECVLVFERIKKFIKNRRKK